MYLSLERYFFFNDNKTHLRNVMFAAIVMYRQFTCPSIVEHLDLWLRNLILNSVDVEPTYCKLHFQHVAR